MNMAIRGMDFDFGKEPANSFTRDQHPDLRADYVMANPPFNMKEWKDGVADDDVRWKYGVPPAGNANFAWLQHMVHHLAPNGSLALLLANGSMSSNTNNEGEIRKALVEADLVECMIALPGQLFINTQIPACIWFLTRDKSGKSPSLRQLTPFPSMGEGRGGGDLRDRRGETLFIDARKLGYMKDRVLRDFAPEDIQKIADTFHAWKSSSPSPILAGEGQGEGKYQDISGFCKAAKLDDIKKNDYVLTPGRYVGAADREDDGEGFEEKMARLTAQLNKEFVESAQLEATIRENLAKLGYDS